MFISGILHLFYLFYFLNSLIDKFVLYIIFAKILNIIL